MQIRQNLPYDIRISSKLGPPCPHSNKTNWKSSRCPFFGKYIFISIELDKKICFITRITFNTFDPIYVGLKEMPGIIQVHGILEDNFGINDRVEYVFHKESCVKGVIFASNLRILLLELTYPKPRMIRNIRCFCPTLNYLHNIQGGS